MKRYLTLFLGLIFIVNYTYAINTSDFCGKIINEEGRPMANVSILLKDKGLVTHSDKEGNFRFSSLKVGQYIIDIQGTSIVSKSVTIEVTAQEHSCQKIKIKTSLQYINAIDIIGVQNRFSSQHNFDVARLPISNMENPQSYNTITKDLFTEQIATSLSQILRNVTSGSVPETGDKGKEGIALRGFGLKTRIKNGMSDYSKTAIDPANIEKIQIIRGPSATLFGSSLTSYGGLVNIITKKPYKRFGGRLSYIFQGADNKNRLTLDLNTPLNKKKTVLFRINAAGNMGQSWQDAGFKNSIFVAPSLTWQISQKVTLDISAEYYKQKATSPFYFSPKKGTYDNVLELPMDFHRSFTNNDLSYTSGQLNFYAKLEANLNKHWTSHTLISNNNNTINGFTQSLKGLTKSLLYHSIKNSDQLWQATEIQQNFLQHQTFGKWDNKLIFGLDFYHYQGQETASSIKIDTVNFTQTNNYYEDGLTLNHVNEALKNGEKRNTDRSQNTYSAYFSDVISFNSRWFAMVSLRFDYFNSQGKTDYIENKVEDKYQQKAFSPKFGIVYQPIKDKLSLFANYMNGFENVNGSNFEGDIFKPQGANQIETGLKFSLFNKRLNGTISGYRILVSNMLRPDPKHDHYDIQDGTQLSRGIDFNATYNPLRGLNIIAGYGFNDSKYVKAEDDLIGVRPYKAGPKNTASLWVSYRLLSGRLKGLGIGGGGFYGSHLYGIKNNTNFYVPAYKVFSATLFYERKYFRLGVKLDNITNERYWDYRLRMHAPRSISISGTIKF